MFLLVTAGSTGAASVPAAALGGALLAGLALYVFAWRQGVHGYRLVLVGIGLAAFTNAGIYYVLTRGRIFEVEQAYVWLVGSLNGRDWGEVVPLAGALAVLVPLMLVLGRRVDALALGDDIARGLGIGVERTRLALLACAVVLTGLAVAAVGADRLRRLHLPAPRAPARPLELDPGPAGRSRRPAARCSCSSPTSPGACSSRRPGSPSGSSPR